MLAGVLLSPDLSGMPRILLVEDDRDVRVLVEHVLIREGYHVDPAVTLAAARTLLADREYQLVLADAALPDGTGFPIADEAERRGIPVIIMTAYAFRYAKEALARFEILLKPVRPAEILEAVGNALRSSQSAC
jgi:DNA-binding response OmpR family regulator